MKELGISKEQLRKLVRGKKSNPKILKQDLSDDTFKFGIVGDTHLCSIHEKLNELHTFYEICRKEKIEVVVHAGDVLAGINVYHGQEFEVHTLGAKKQVDYVAKNYPKVKGIKTYFILGNHDMVYWHRMGIDVGDMISTQREDMVYLGQYQGDLFINGIDIRLVHPDKSGAYAVSYNLQKMAEQIPSGKKPHIFIAGHYHTSLYFFYRLIHLFQAGCFEDQSLFLLRKGINPTIGGWTVKVRIAKDKTILSITPTFIPFIERRDRWKKR